MKHLVIILGLAFSTGYIGPVHKGNDKKTSTIKAVKIKTPDTNRLSNTYYVVTRKPGSPARNAAEAQRIADVASVSYPNGAYLSSSICRSWWLSQTVVEGPNSVTWSYYYSAGGTVNVTGNYYLLICPY